MKYTRCTIKKNESWVSVPYRVQCVTNPVHVHPPPSLCVSQDLPGATEGRSTRSMASIYDVWQMIRPVM